MRGGKRPNAGRKKSENKTTTIAFRVRIEVVESIKKLVKDYVLKHTPKLANK